MTENYSALVDELYTLCRASHYSTALSNPESYVEVLRALQTTEETSSETPAVEPIATGAPKAALEAIIRQEASLRADPSTNKSPEATPGEKLLIDWVARLIRKGDPSLAHVSGLLTPFNAHFTMPCN